VPENTPVWIGRVLDGGAIGIVVPHIDSSADAKRAVDAARYSPAGLRSLSGMLPQFGYRALPAREQMAQAEALTFVVGIIKTKEAIEQIDATVCMNVPLVDRSGAELRIGAEIVDAHPVIERGARRPLVEQASTGAQANAVTELRHRLRRLE
jgi:hypothetical protein